MFLRNKKGMVSLLLASCLVFTAEFEVLAANPQSEAQAIETTNYEIEVASLADTWNEISAMANIAADTQEWYGKALADIESKMSVYAEADADSTVVGKVYNNTVLTVEEEGETWTKISSGSVEGYVKTEKLLFGSKAVERAETACAEGTREAQTLEEIETEKKQADVKLMAAIIYCEAGNQSYKGKVAVGAVIMNRIASKRFPNTLKGVIYQKGQFTPAMTGKLDRVLKSGNIPSSCYDAAVDAMNGENPVGNALFFNMYRGKFKLGDHYFS